MLCIEMMGSHDVLQRCLFSDGQLNHFKGPIWITRHVAIMMMSFVKLLSIYSYGINLTFGIAEMGSHTFLLNNDRFPFPT